MDRKEIREILTSPYLELVKIALNMVNLTDKEREIIENIELKGLTDERCAEKLDMSVRRIRELKSKALEKIGIVWNNNIYIKLLQEIKNKKI